MVIDFHAHIYPDRIAPKAVENIGAFYTLPMQGDGTVKGLLESAGKDGIDRRGISRFVVFSAAAAPGQVSNINNYIASVCAEHPELTGFGTLHPGQDDPEAEIGRFTGLGLRGVKFHHDMQRIDIDDRKMMDLYALLEGKYPVVFHAGDYRYGYSHPSRLARVLDSFPKLTVVAAHFGGWSVFDLALEYFRQRFCYFDISSSLPFLGKKRACELIRIYGAERFLFGSDYPMWNPARCLEEFLELDLSERERELILHRNAEGILGKTW
ncbi:MAG: amidohydrolase family protein [Treponema sp.]|jgi:predicted TIM-barrel fold metal-dependent hydrolase|nr:amidohydrolase family protein [Treponema sp.]